MSPVAPEVQAAVRHTVRGLLEGAPGWTAASPELRRTLARRLTALSLKAAEMLTEEARWTELVRAKRPTSRTPVAPLAEAMATPRQRERAAQADPLRPFTAPAAAGRAVQDLRTALDFPSYVTQLITGVFQAITRSTLQQMESLADLLDNVSASVESFTERNIGEDDAARWASERFPFLQRQGNGALGVRPGTDLVDHERQLRDQLGATSTEVRSIDPSNPGETLLPLVRRRMGRDRQSILATIIQLGLQRIVVDEGRLHASMDMRVDARSLRENAAQNQTGVDFHTSAQGQFSMGVWGASAKMGLAVTHVHADQQYTKDELTAQAGLRSSVDLAFRTEQIPLDRMADPSMRARLDLNARVPANVAEGSPLTQGRQHTPVALQPPQRSEPPPIIPTGGGADGSPTESAGSQGSAPAPTTETPSTNPASQPSAEEQNNG